MAVTVKSPPPDSREIPCTGCGYILEYMQRDIQTCLPNYDLGDTEAYRYIICPRSACRKRVTIPDPPEYDDV